MIVSNLKVWDQVCKTDPNMTEKVNFGAFKFTTIDAMYQVRQATSVFGPCGTGWGLRNQKFEMLTVDTTDAHFNLLLFTAELWYKLDGQEGMYEIAADIELFENTKNGWKRVSDPMKKVRTDALTKGLSWLGFGADVFMGKFDDARYVNDLKREFSQPEPKPKAPAVMPSISPVEPSDPVQNQSYREQQAAELRSLRMKITAQAKAINFVGDDLKKWITDTHRTTWEAMTTGKAEIILADLVAMA